MTPLAVRDALMQRAIDAFYAGKLDEAREASEALLSIGGLEGAWLAAALRNSTFYAPRLSELAPDLHRSLLQPSREDLAARDPSPAAVGGRLVALLDEGHVPWASFPAAAIQGVALDGSGEALSRFEALVAGGHEAARCRLTALGSGGAALCAWIPGEPSAVVMRLGPDALLADSPALVTDAAGSEGPSWMPFDRDGRLLLVTRVQPARVVRVLEGGAVEALAERIGPPVMGRLEGSSTGVWFGDGWLFVLRQIAEFEDGHSVSLHRFALLGEDFAWSRLGQPFRFGDGDDRMERCAGLALAGDRLLAGVGAEDREAWVYGIPLAAVRAMLRPIGDWADPERPVPIEVLRVGDLLDRNIAPPPRLAPPPEARQTALDAFRVRLAAMAAPLAAPPRRSRRAPVVRREPSPAEQYRKAVRRLEGGAGQAAQICGDPALATGAIAELPWLAAFACWLAGDDERAVELAAAAGALGWIGGRPVPPAHEMAAAWFEGPADVQRHALRRMGADAAAAERTFEAALAAHTAWDAARANDAPGRRHE